VRWRYGKNIAELFISFSRGIQEVGGMSPKALENRRKQIMWRLKHHTYYNTVDYQKQAKLEYDEERDDTRKRVP
jgi:hypothetical protein